MPRKTHPLVTHLGRFLAIALLGLFLIANARAEAGWDVVKIGDRDYVSVDSIKTFYTFEKMTRVGDSVSLVKGTLERGVKIDFRIGSQECLMNSVKFVFSYPIITSGSKILVSRMDLAKLIDPVLRPNFIRNAGDCRTVILDAGHGGKDPGATNPFGTEARYTLIIANKVKALLQAKGFKVLMTRDSDRYLGLQERVNLANEVKDNAVFISIHFNSGGRAARGIETFSLSPQGIAHYGRNVKSSDLSTFNGNEHDSANIALATAVHGSVLRRLGTNTFDRGIKRARWSVLTGVQHPAILVECGFVTHPYEAGMIEKVDYQNAVAAGIYEAVLKYRYAVGSKTAP